MKTLTIAVAVICSLTAQASSQGTKHYLINATSQGRGSTAAAAAAVAACKGVVTGAVDDLGVLFADSANPNFLSLMGHAQGVQSLAEDAEVQWIAPRVAGQDKAPALAAAPLANQESRSALQWNLRQIGADKAADQGFRGRGARVAVLDSGIIPDHPDIASNLNLALSRSFVPGEPGLDPGPGAFNHGTHVAGIIAAPINGIGVQGVAPEAEIVAVKVLSAAGSASFSWIIQGLVYASSPGVHADVINMSLGATFDRINAGGGGAGPLLSALNRAIAYATASGSLCVTAAGNEGVDLDGRLVSIPAQSGNGMAVSATGPVGFGKFGSAATFDRLASYSNFGRSVVSVAAPGGDDVFEPEGEICTVNTAAGAVTNLCWVFDMVFSPASYQMGTRNKPKAFYYSWADGTSMAAPHVSGLAALIVGKYGHMPPAQLRTRIAQTAADILNPGADAETGSGRIDALRALTGK